MLKNIAILIAFTAFIALLASYRANSPRYVEKTFESGTTYTGEMLGDEPHGYGTWMWAWGEGYEDYWENGFEHGDGIFITSDGKRIPGKWKRGRLLGSWYADPKTGCKIWWSPMKEPVGELSWSGACVDGKASGEGEVFWSIGEYGAFSESEISFNGTLKAGVIEGHGTWAKKTVHVNVIDYEIYDGNWADGVRDGYGEHSHQSNSTPGNRYLKYEETYRGSWKENQFSGNGQFHKSKKIGNGPVEETTLTGMFSKGKLNGDGVSLFVAKGESGSLRRIEQTGIFVNGLLAGKGSTTLKLVDGIRTSSSFIEGEFGNGGELSGEIIYFDGSSFTGKFSSGHNPIPFEGHCESKSNKYSGPCEARRTKSSSPQSGEICLVPKGKTEPCLVVIRSWIT